MAGVVAVSLSRGGSERDVHLIDVETGQRVHAIIEHVNGDTAGGILVGLPDPSGFFYTRDRRSEGGVLPDDIIEDGPDSCIGRTFGRGVA